MLNICSAYPEGQDWLLHPRRKARLAGAAKHSRHPLRLHGFRQQGRGGGGIEVVGGLERAAFGIRKRLAYFRVET